MPGRPPFTKWVKIDFNLSRCDKKIVYLTGFPDAIKAVYPKTQVQLCIVHMVRNSLRYVPHKDMKVVAADLKGIYHSVSVEAGEHALDEFCVKWDEKYPSIGRSWRNKWDNIITLFDYPQEIRKIIYTTNAIESLNRVIRKTFRNRKIFPSDQSALKVVYVAISKRPVNGRWLCMIGELP